MLLKPYQKQIIDDLARYLEILKEKGNTAVAFNEFWQTHPRTAITPMLGESVEPYKNNVPGVPHVCIKVPTAGGKTFIAANALNTIFSAFDASRPKPWCGLFRPIPSWSRPFAISAIQSIRTANS